MHGTVIFFIFSRLNILSLCCIISMMWFSFHRWQVRCNATGIVGVVLMTVGSSQWRNSDHEASVERVAAGSLLACQMVPAGNWMKWKKCTWNERHLVIDARYSLDAFEGRIKNRNLVVALHAVIFQKQHCSSFPFSARVNARPQAHWISLNLGEMSLFGYRACSVLISLLDWICNFVSCLVFTYSGRIILFIRDFNDPVREQI